MFATKTPKGLAIDDAKLAAQGDGAHIGLRLKLWSEYYAPAAIFIRADGDSPTRLGNVMPRDVMRFC